jgi:phosphatidylglycerol---prolipoprotein diacylglyceryl transferase
MHPILVGAGPFTLQSYGVLLAFAFLAGILFTLWLSKKEGIAYETVVDLALYIMIGGIVGGRVLYVISFWQEYAGNPLEILMVQHGGLVLLGGVIGGFIATLLFSLRHKISFWRLADMTTPGVFLGFVIGRWGCFLRGCCYGTVCDLPWAVTFPEVYGARHPTQIYESLFSLLIFIVVILVRRKKRFEGQVMLIGVILYSVFRFMNESLRDLPVFYGLPGSQWLTVIFFIGAVSFYYLRQRNNRTNVKKD